MSSVFDPVLAELSERHRDEVLAGFIVFLAVLVLRPQGLISRGAQS